MRSFWLSKKKGKESYAKPAIDRDARTVRFEIATKGEPPKHTTDRNGARCLFCDTFIKKAPLRDIAIAHGVAEIPLAVVVEGENGRIHLSGDAVPVTFVAKPSVPFLEQPMTNDKRWFSPPLYGLPNFADLFTSRQLVALTTFSDLVHDARERVVADARKSDLTDDPRPLAENGQGPTAYSDAMATYLAFCVDKMTDTNSTLCTWQNDPPRLRATFGRQALPMTWDIAEAGIFGDAAGDFQRAFGALCEVLDQLPLGCEAQVKQLDAASALLKGNVVVSTDPPYYDNIGYADLSDYFYVWLRRSLASYFPTLFSTVLTPKSRELIASSHRHEGNREKAQVFFESGLGKAFAKMNEAQDLSYPLSVFYAFKQAESDDDGEEESTNSIVATSTGWETMLSGLIGARFVVSGTWPMRSELSTRNVGRGTNALASSIVIVCRPRSSDAPLATRKEFMNTLRRDLPDALKNLQHGNIAPVDLAQASIGPGMAVFTRYAKVVESNGKPMTVRTALGIINQVLDEVLAEQEGDFDPDTRWALAWFEQYGTGEGPFGVAETLSKAKNTAIKGLEEAGVVKAGKGKVQLLGRTDLPDDWNPATDKRLTVWETTQHLIRALETKGESEAASLMNKLGGFGETARELAYRLYSICERKKWAQDAMAYNSLVIAWPELSKLALSQRNRQPTIQQDLF